MINKYSFPPLNEYICNIKGVVRHFNYLLFIKEVFSSDMKYFKRLSFKKRTGTRSHSFVESPTPVSNVFDDVEENEIDYSSSIEQETDNKIARYLSFFVGRLNTKI
jgi:hypothetical protein